MKRGFDLCLVIVAILLFSVPICAIAFCVFVTSKGPVLFWSSRVGRDNELFKMPKFRTMKLGTPVVATSDLKEPMTYLTSIGSWLRKTSLDELPQLWSILKGDMSFVGPRPALYSQYDLIQLRCDRGVDKLRPGLTGWAQVNGRDEIALEQKVFYDLEYLQRQSIKFDLYVICLTAFKVIQRQGVSH
jgi:O-antigen biosynthesis protein WbqP